MATSNKERQQKFRENQRAKGSKRLDIILPNSTHDQLTQIALSGNKSKKAVIEELLRKEFERITPAQNSTQDSGQNSAWFAQQPPAPVTV